eukprot:690541-Amphidinium_carterae.1
MASKHPSSPATVKVRPYIGQLFWVSGRRPNSSTAHLQQLHAVRVPRGRNAIVGGELVLIVDEQVINSEARKHSKSKPAEATTAAAKSEGRAVP